MVLKNSVLKSATPKQDLTTFNQFLMAAMFFSDRGKWTIFTKDLTKDAEYQVKVYLIR